MAGEAAQLKPAATGPRVVVIGWHGSTERHLRAIARTWESLGAEAVTVVPDSWRGMSKRNGWRAIGEELAARLFALDAQGPRRLVLHTFSNAGFWTMVATLDACARLYPSLHARLETVLIDSAPGFPEKVSPRFTAKFASMAMAPALLAALGREPRHHHWLVSPALSAFLGFWHRIAPAQVRFMESSQARLLSLVGGRPITVLHGDADELVPHRFVEEFAARARLRGPVTVVLFRGSGHVRHLGGHRRRYVEAMRAAIAAAPPAIEA